MGEAGKEKAGLVLDRFVEGLFRVMLEHHRTHLVEMELTIAQAQALMLLRAEPGTASGVAAMLNISAPAVTQLTDRLVRKRLIERRSVETDRRSVSVALTAEGKRAVDLFRRRRRQVFAQALERLTREDQIEVIDALDKIASVLDTRPTETFERPTETFERPRKVQPVVEPAESREARTAVEPAQASKEVGKAPVGLPKKRMRIEWD